MTSPARGSLQYLIAAAIGVGATFLMLPWATITGDGGLWLNAGGDAAVALTGHLAYQAPGWHWPLLTAQNLFWPGGLSIVLTDSNPVLSVAAKLLAAARGHPANLLGYWLALCWSLQPVTAVYCLRSFRQPSLEAAVAATLLSLLCPAWLFRRHINLLGHFLLLAALGLAVRMITRGTPAWWQAGAVLMLAMFVHPYLFVFTAIILSAPALKRVFDAKTRRWRAFLPYACCCALPLAAIRLLGGPVNAGASGFTHYSMNLISPIWPQRSGLFGVNLPIIDATGGQYEGFNYLGAGILLVLFVAAWRLLRRQLPVQVDRNVLFSATIPLVILSLLALTPRIWAGHWLVLPLPAQPWRSLFGALQSSGRAFWVVGYALTAAALAVIDARLSRPARIAILAAAIVLQFLDTAPLRADAASRLAGSLNLPAPFPIPPDTRLLRVAPACDPVTFQADQLRLEAARLAISLGEVRVARLPAGFDCEASVADALETPLIAGEVRVFLPSIAVKIRPDALGARPRCTLSAIGEVCSRDLSDPPPGPPAPPAHPLSDLASGPVGPPDLTPLLASFWRLDAQGLPWSEGPRATLLFRLPPPLRATGATLTLTLDAIAAQPGGTRRIMVGVNDAAPMPLDLPDLRPTPIAVPLPPGDGSVRIVFDLKRPIDPASRKLTSP